MDLIGLADCKNFYASCERVFCPRLRQKPVVVLSNNDGCIIARSNEAKAFVPMGAPAFKYRNTFAAHGVDVFSANFALYGDMSHRVMSILGKNVPAIEFYSIDEAFLDLKGILPQEAENHARQLRRKVLTNTHIPVSIRLALTKVLAKTANHIAKKFPTQCDGVYVIDSEEKRINALRRLKIEDVWGIGRQNAAKLGRLGVSNALEYSKMDGHHY